MEVKKKENNNMLRVSVDQFPTIMTSVNALFNSTNKIFQC